MEPLTKKEISHCDHMLQENWKKEYNYAGGFQTQLMHTIEHADEINLRKLESVYPNLVTAYRKWSGQTQEAIDDAKDSLKIKGIDI